MHASVEARLPTDNPSRGAIPLERFRGKGVVDSDPSCGLQVLVPNLFCNPDGSREDVFSSDSTSLGARGEEASSCENDKSRHQQETIAHLPLRDGLEGVKSVLVEIGVAIHDAHYSDVGQKPILISERRGRIMTEIKCHRFVVEKKCFQIQRFENAHGNSTRIAEKGRVQDEPLEGIRCHIESVGGNSKVVIDLDVGQFHYWAYVVMCSIGGPEVEDDWEEVSKIISHLTQRNKIFGFILLILDEPSSIQAKVNKLIEYAVTGDISWKEVCERCKELLEVMEFRLRAEEPEGSSMKMDTNAADKRVEVWRGKCDVVPNLQCNPDSLVIEIIALVSRVRGLGTESVNNPQMEDLASSSNGGDSSSLLNHEVGIQDSLIADTAKNESASHEVGFEFAIRVGSQCSMQTLEAEDRVLSVSNHDQGSSDGAVSTLHHRLSLKHFSGSNRVHVKSACFAEASPGFGLKCLGSLGAEGTNIQTSSLLASQGLEWMTLNGCSRVYMGHRLTLINCNSGRNSMMWLLIGIFRGILFGLLGKDPMEVGTPKTHRRFLTCDNGTYGPMLHRFTKGLLGMPFNTTMDSNCVGDSCFPGEGVIAVAFSGVMCAHRETAILACFVMSLPKLVSRSQPSNF
ncbi:hypothetical protein HHK36_011515 [Tetracentron sinense]|uniref:Uncharacterized protein n=1 Tax=Tetracentron sinense TaxID=13715 RepID=A0A835DJY4_TETSI|nr:hypothetical protein HHK36_011515 [Tetracentron sinense]